MRILHLSDIHIGVENYGRPATESEVAALPPHFAPGADRAQYVGMSTRLLDFLCTLDEAMAHALANDVDLVLFAGDAYKSRDPSQTHQREFARRIARLSRAGIPVFLTVGNHDLPHVANRATALEIFPTLAVDNVTVGATLETYRVSTRHGPVQVVALPWVRIGEFMKREETRNLTLEQITRSVEARITALLQEQAEALDPSLPAFLCAHVTVTGAVYASERTMMLGNDHALTLGTMANPAFDYVALGHIHKHQVLTRNPHVVYPGSLQRVDFSEEAQAKGFCVIDLDERRPRGERLRDFRFVEVGARRLLTIDARAGEGDDPTDKCLIAIEKQASLVEGAVVRLRVAMPTAVAPLFREPTVRQALAPAHHVAGIERQIQRDHRTRLGDEDAASLTPIDALRRYLAARNTPEARKRDLVAAAEELLRHEVEGHA
ncbi:MAG: exonuclease SbcCD subunit D [SAR202 cluster bacterium]|nr:exonuclease SbcCD subunit D [SAR202 cluster bacterium]